MVAPQPQITPDDARRIAAFFQHGRCPFAFADHTGIPLHDLLSWLAQPGIQEMIALITRLENDAHRAAAIGALRQTIDQSENLVEKRRAACAILRTLLARPSRPPQSASAAPDSPRDPQPPPDSGGGASPRRPARDLRSTSGAVDAAPLAPEASPEPRDRSDPVPIRTSGASGRQVPASTAAEVSFSQPLDRLPISPQPAAVLAALAGGNIKRAPP